MSRRASQRRCVARAAARMAIGRPHRLHDRVADRARPAAGQRRASSAGRPRSRSTRPIARRRARGSFDLCAGFVYAQVLLACVRLRLFDLLADGPRPLADWRRACLRTRSATERLLAAAASLDLAARRSGGRFGLGPLGRGLARQSRRRRDDRAPRACSMPTCAIPWRCCAARPARRARRLLALCSARRPGDLEPEAVAAYSGLMAASQPHGRGRGSGGLSVGAASLPARCRRRRRCFLAAAARRAPDLRLMLFDLPAVAERAERGFAAAGLAARAEAIGGNFLTDPLPAGADIVSLVRVVHDHDDAAALTSCARSAQALPAGRHPAAGRADGRRRPAPSRSGTPISASTCWRWAVAGPRTPAELSEMLAEGRFRRARSVADPDARC